MDDNLFFDPIFISEVISKIRQQDLELEVEDILVGLRGVHIAWNAERGTVTLTRRGLAWRIVEALQNLLEKKTRQISQRIW